MIWRERNFKFDPNYEEEVSNLKRMGKFSTFSDKILTPSSKSWTILGVLSLCPQILSKLGLITGVCSGQGVQIELNIPSWTQTAKWGRCLWNWKQAIGKVYSFSAPIIHLIKQIQFDDECPSKTTIECFLIFTKMSIRLNLNLTNQLNKYLRKEGKKQRLITTTCKFWKGGFFVITPRCG